MDDKIENAATQTAARTAERVVEELKAMIQRAEEKAVEQAKAADRVIHDHPYPAIGLAFGLGVLIGVLATRHFK